MAKKIEDAKVVAENDGKILDAAMKEAGKELGQMPSPLGSEPTPNKIYVIEPISHPDAFVTFSDIDFVVEGQPYSHGLFAIMHLRDKMYPVAKVFLSAFFKVYPK